MHSSHISPSTFAFTFLLPHPMSYSYPFPFYSSYLINCRVGGCILVLIHEFKQSTHFFLVLFVQSLQKKTEYSISSKDINGCWHWFKKSRQCKISSAPILMQLGSTMKIPQITKNTQKNIIAFKKQCMYCRVLPETCLYLYHEYTPLQQSGFWIMCKRYCADLYS